MSDEYTDILIRIFAKQEASFYYVEASLNDGSMFPKGELCLDMNALLTNEIEPKKYGLLLSNNLFTGEILRAYDIATGRAQGETEGRLRVRLWIDDDAVELHALPWERLYHLHRNQPLPLAMSVQTPFSRYTTLNIPEAQPIRERPVRLLIAIANPRNLSSFGLSSLAVEQEVDNLRYALGDLRQAAQIQVTLLPGRSGLSSEVRAQLAGDRYQIENGATSLNRVLQLLPGHHILHFLGHGYFDPQQGTAALYLEKDDGNLDVVPDEKLVPQLAADSLPHLVFMTACESAKRKVGHPFVGLGPKLVKAGVPAVVAMQDVVPMALARQLSHEFYRRLMEHGIVDLALNQARLLIFKSDQVDWAIPVLFMRLEQGQLFAPESVEQKQTVSVNKSLNALTELMQVAEVKDAVVTFQANFEIAREKIDVLADYKGLHDLLHTMQVQCYRLIASEAKHSSDEVAWGDLVDYSGELNSIIKDLQNIVNKSSFADTENKIAWIPQLVRAREELDRAIENCNISQLKEAEGCIDRVLSYQPSRINGLLSGVVHYLPLTTLEEAMKAVCVHLNSPDLDLDKVRQFKDGVDALAKLKHSLDTLIEEHDIWQLVDQRLRIIEVTLIYDTVELEDSWPDLVRWTKPLYSSSSEEWAVSFKENSEKLAGAIATEEPAKAKQYFGRYCSLAVERFYKVDLALKELCDNLRLIGEPLDSVLRMIAT